MTVEIVLLTVVLILGAISVVGIIYFGGLIVAQKLGFDVKMARWLDRIRLLW